MKASYKECDLVVGYQKVHLQPGEFIFGRKKASEETFLSEQEIRTCLDSLRRLQNLTIKTTNKYSIISIINWNLYQDEDFQINQQTELTSKTPKINQQLTNKQPTKDVDIIGKSTYNLLEENGDNEKSTSKTPKINHKQEALKNKEKNIFIIPSIEKVAAYCQERKNSVNPEKWHAYYSSNGWKVGKNKMQDWHAAIRTWEQSDYGGNTDGRRQGTSGSPGKAIGKAKTVQGDGQQYPIDAEF